MDELIFPHDRVGSRVGSGKNLVRSDQTIEQFDNWPIAGHVARTFPGIAGSLAIDGNNAQLKVESKQDDVS